MLLQELRAVMRVRPVREAAQMTCRRAVRGKRLDARGTMLLIERRVMLRLPHRRSQMLGTGTVQRVEVSRRALQSVTSRPQIVVRPLKGVVVNRPNATRVEAAVIHARLAVLADRRSTLHLTAKVRRPLARLRNTTKVLGTTRIPDASATNAAASHASTTEAASPHVSTADMAGPTGASAADMASSSMTPTAADVASSSTPPTTASSTATSTRAAGGREVLKAEQ